jgi:Asp-tRNA(Asn)/Glu-tRNA(Gln) amidotransferase A subunit family amidase
METTDKGAVEFWVRFDAQAFSALGATEACGVIRNPHDPEHLVGGSSGGSAVAARFVPLARGSDTNGSIRIPAALCDVWGMRLAKGAISLGGVFPVVETLDTMLLAGPLRPTKILHEAHEWGEITRTRFGSPLEDHDLRIAPAMPITAPRIDTATVIIDGQPVSARANLGIYCRAPGREAQFFDLLEKLETADGFPQPAEARL